MNDDVCGEKRWTGSLISQGLPFIEAVARAD